MSPERRGTPSLAGALKTGRESRQFEAINQAGGNLQAYIDLRDATPPEQWDAVRNAFIGAVLGLLSPRDMKLAMDLALQLVDGRNDCADQDPANAGENPL